MIASDAAVARDHEGAERHKGRSAPEEGDRAQTSWPVVSGRQEARTRM